MLPNLLTSAINKWYIIECPEMIWAISSVGQSTCLTSKGSQVRVLYRPPFIYAEIAQLVEQLTCNQQVTGSIPVFGTIFFGGIAKWSNAADCKSVPSGSMVQIHVPPPLCNYIIKHVASQPSGKAPHFDCGIFASSNLAEAAKIMLRQLSRQSI